MEPWTYQWTHYRSLQSNYWDSHRL